MKTRSRLGGILFAALLVPGLAGARADSDEKRSERQPRATADGRKLDGAEKKKGPAKKGKTAPDN